jgi:hypothetical protein
MTDMKEWSISVVVAIIIITSSCVPSKTIADTCCPKYKSEIFQRDDIANKGLAVMPEIGPNKNQIHSSPLRDEITAVLLDEFDDELIISSSQVIATLNELAVANEYTSAVEELQSSGSLNRDFLSFIGNSVGVDYLLFIKLLPDTYKYFDDKIELSELFVQTQVLSVSSGSIVWEGIGGYAAYTEPTVNITKETARSLVKIIGNGPGEGPCESTNDIILSVKNARLKSTIGVIVTAGVTVLIILPAIFISRW